MNLENATIIERYIGQEYGIVLRSQSHDGSIEYATHEFRVNDFFNTYWGHYYFNEESARKDFIERVNAIRNIYEY